MVPYWVPELGLEIGTQFQIISFPLEFMLPRYGQDIRVEFVSNFFPSSSIFNQCFSMLVILCEGRDGNVYFWSCGLLANECEAAAPTMKQNNSGGQQLVPKSMPEAVPLALPTLSSSNIS